MNLFRDEKENKKQPAEDHSNIMANTDARRYTRSKALSQPAAAAAASRGNWTVHQTSHAELEERHPAILKYRERWEALGFSVKVTPGNAIRRDVERMQALTENGSSAASKSNSLLDIFDRLPNEVLRYDFWRYVILYLEGGVYADVDCEPFAGMQEAIQLATHENKPFLFAETDIAEVLPRWMQMIAVSLWYFVDIPQYANFIMVAPQKHHPFFRDLLRAIDFDKWVHLQEPKRTLMIAGPHHLTIFARERLAAGQTDVLLGHYKQSRASFIHHCFGTWKSRTLMFYEYVLAPFGLLLLFVLLSKLLFRVIVGRRRIKLKK